MTLVYLISLDRKQPLNYKERMLMKKKILISTLCMLFSGLCNWYLLHANTAPLQAKIIELKRQGWKVTEKHSRVEARPVLNLIKT